MWPLREESPAGNQEPPESSALRATMAQFMASQRVTSAPPEVIGPGKEELCLPTKIMCDYSRRSYQGASPPLI